MLFFPLHLHNCNFILFAGKCRWIFLAAEFLPKRDHYGWEIDLQGGEQPFVVFCPLRLFGGIKTQSQYNFLENKVLVSPLQLRLSFKVPWEKTTMSWEAKKILAISENNQHFYTLFEIFIFCPKIQIWFPEKIVDFFLGEKLVKVLWFWTF